LLTACGSGSESNSDDSNSTDAIPTVNAGPDFTVLNLASVTLSATVTYDGATTVTWTKISGTDVALTTSTTTSTSFTAPNAVSEEELIFKISVEDGVNDAVTDSITVTVDPDYDEATDWIINSSGRSTTIFESAISNLGVLINVQSAEEKTVDAINYIHVEASGIPGYEVVMTEDIINSLNSRPNASHDFSAGVTTASVGDTVIFGGDIGYDNRNSTNCSDTGGIGYWPFGPECPTDQNISLNFPSEPEESAESCSTNLGPVGLMVNGTHTFGWGDGQSYGSDIWYQLAAQAEYYAVDICGGHTGANGTYHHHFYSSCLANMLGDNGTDHSPIYGYIFDGYPIYGPYESNGELAVSGWAKRDYGAPESEGGCATEGERTCILIDEYHISQGVNASVEQGPDIGEEITVGPDRYPTDLGFYYEGFYYIQAEAVGNQLDQHNGHDNDDGRGYHYHITVTYEDGTLTTSFPHTAGPLYKGKVENFR